MCYLIKQKIESDPCAIDILLLSIVKTVMKYASRKSRYCDVSFCNSFSKPIYMQLHLMSEKLLTAQKSNGLVVRLVRSNKCSI